MILPKEVGRRHYYVGLVSTWGMYVCMICIYDTIPYLVGIWQESTTWKEDNYQMAPAT